MTNDEKILELLMQMQSNITDLKTDVSGLKSDFADLKTDVSGLKSDVADLKTDVSGLKSDVTDLKTDVSGLKSDVVDLKTDVSGLKSDVTDLKTDVSGLKSDVADLKTGQEHLAQNLVNLENELVPKVTALFDGYTLRGEQIDHLKQHFDERFDDFQEDVTYLISKTAKQEKQIFSVSKQVKQILPQ